MYKHACSRGYQQGTVKCKTATHPETVSPGSLSIPQVGQSLGPFCDYRHAKKAQAHRISVSATYLAWPCSRPCCLQEPNMCPANSCTRVCMADWTHSQPHVAQHHTSLLFASIPGCCQSCRLAHTYRQRTHCLAASAYKRQRYVRDHSRNGFCPCKSRACNNLNRPA